MNVKNLGNILALIIITIFVIMSLARHYDMDTYQKVLDCTGDDWSRYALFGLDIKEHGILLPCEKSSYYFPAGFFYNYFIALCLVLFGVRSIPVFIVQHLMLGLSVALIYWAFRDKLRGITSLLLLGALYFFALKDVYKNYAPLLISENLALFTISLFFFFFVKGFDKDNFALQLLAAVFMGLSVLTRPNIVIFAILLPFIVMPYYFKKGGRGFRRWAVFLIVLFLSSSILCARNYLVCKELHFLPTQVSSVMTYVKNFNPIPSSVDMARVDTNFLYTKLHISKDIVGYAEYAMQKPSVFFNFYFRKVLFVLGYLPALEGGHGMRVHWMLMWAGYFIYLFLRIGSCKKWEIWEIAAHTYIFSYYGSLIAAANVNNYGFRMLIPALFFVLVFAIRVIDMLRPSALHK